MVHLGDNPVPCNLPDRQGTAVEMMLESDPCTIMEVCWTLELSWLEHLALVSGLCLMKVIIKFATQIDTLADEYLSKTNHL